MGGRGIEHHHSTLVSGRITFLYRLKRKQNPKVSVWKVIPVKEGGENCLVGVL